MKVKRQHLIAQGYLRAWTTDNKRVLYVDKSELTAKLVGIRSIFVVPNLLTFQINRKPSIALETEFGQVESRAIPLVRDFIDGANEKEHHLAVKALVALHFARSSSVKSAYDRIREQMVGELTESAHDDAELIDAFRADKGRAPAVRELRDLIEQVALDAKQRNVLFAESVERMYNTALDRFSSLHLQRVTVNKPNRAELLISDSPVVLNDGEHGTASEPVALEDADFLWFPLSPSYGVSLTTQPQPSATLDETITRLLNKRSWDCASRYLVARAGSNVNRAIGYEGARITLG